MPTQKGNIFSDKITVSDSCLWRYSFR